MTYSDSLAKRRRAIWVSRFTVSSPSQRETFADEVVAMERELDQRRHEAQRLVLFEELDQKAQELGYEDVEDVLDWAFEQLEADADLEEE